MNFYYLLKIKRMVLTTRLSKGERGDKNSKLFYIFCINNYK